MIVFPNAKINIGLNITEKRPDGFHNIESVFYPIGLSDILEITPSHNEIYFKNTGLIVENKNLESNLCYKAYEILKKDFPLKNVNIHLHKIIPFGAGLGGGSSDASFTLKMLNSEFNLGLTHKDLMSYAEKLGSDCPFFMINKPAFATGKGEILNKIDLSLKGYYVVLIHPGIHVNTTKAYSKITPKHAETQLVDLIEKPIETWRNSIINDFEEIVFKEHSVLKTIKEELYSLGSVYASMSGSGSAIYGIFDRKPDLKSNFDNYFIWIEKL